MLKIKLLGSLGALGILGTTGAGVYYNLKKDNNQENNKKQENQTTPPKLHEDKNKKLEHQELNTGTSGTNETDNKKTNPEQLTDNSAKGPAKLAESSDETEDTDPPDPQTPKESTDPGQYSPQIDNAQEDNQANKNTDTPAEDLNKEGTSDV